jgi:hypothetical protein
MITKAQYKRLDNKGERPFSVVKDLTLEILTENPSVEGTTKTFIKDGNFMGELVAVKLQRKMDNGNWIRYGEGKGFMVRKEDKSGFWLVPFSVTKPSSNPVEDVLPIIKNEQDTLIDEVNKDIQYINENPQKKVLGFTYKQIAIIAVLLLIVRKL